MFSTHIKDEIQQISTIYFTVCKCFRFDPLKILSSCIGLKIVSLPEAVKTSQLPIFLKNFQNRNAAKIMVHVFDKA